VVREVVHARVRQHLPGVINALGLRDDTDQRGIPESIQPTGAEVVSAQR
jgi:hypothetical protein